jgi:amidase
MDLTQLDATAQAELVGRGELRPVELVEAAIARIEKLNPVLNAVICPLFDKALQSAADASGPFAGVPMLLKDYISHSAGDPFHEGMSFLKELGWTEPSDSFVVEKFRAAGFVVCGKTNTPELGTNPTTEPAAYGATRNPWSVEHTPGGSSGGSAAAVASRMVPVAHANDSGGSIRTPASACGLVGLKPSRGRVSLGPDFGQLMGGMNVEHALTLSVRDSAAVLDAIAGPMPGDPYSAPVPLRPFRVEVGADPGQLRIGFLTGFDATHEECRTAVRDAAQLLESLGHVVEEDAPAALDDRLTFGQHALALWTSSIAWRVWYWSARTGRKIHDEDLEPFTAAIARSGRDVTATALWDAHEWFEGFTRRMASWWTGHDLLLCPAVGEPAPLLGELAGTDPDDPYRPVIRGGVLQEFGPIFNATGQPAVSLPLHWTPDGLPVGVQLVAAYGREDLLFRVGAQLEAAVDWKRRLPPQAVSSREASS